MNKLGKGYQGRGPLKLFGMHSGNRFYYKSRGRYTGKQVRARMWAMAIACERHPERNPRSWF